MSSFTIKLQRTATHTTEFTYEADDEDTAYEAVTLIFNGSTHEATSKFETENKLEWELEDEGYEVLEVTENTGAED